MPQIARLIAFLCLPALAGCAELYQLRERTVVQDEEIHKLREANGEIKKAYDKLAEMRTSESGALRADIEELRRDLNQARQDRTTREKALEEQLRQSQLASGAAAQDWAGKLDQSNAAISAMSESAAKAAEERASLQGQLDALNSKRAADLQKIQLIEAELAAATKSGADLQSKLQGAEEKAKSLGAAREEADKLKKDLDKRKAAEPQNDPKLQEAEKKLKEKLAGAAGAGVEARLDSRGLRIIIPSDFAFAKASVALTEEARPILEEAAAAIAALPGYAVRIEGHTDNDPILDLPFADNWGLGAARADSVRQRLAEAKGIESKRMTVVSRAHHDPLVDNKTAENKAKNRRVEIVIGGAAK